MVKQWHIRQVIVKFLGRSDEGHRMIYPSPTWQGRKSTVQLTVEMKRTIST